MKTADDGTQHTEETCGANASHISDALYVLGGKWKLALIFSLTRSPKRFSELQKMLTGIGPKMLAKDLKELELNEFVIRVVDKDNPMKITYEATPYSRSLSKVLSELNDWGMQHREKIKQSMRRA